MYTYRNNITNNMLIPAVENILEKVDVILRTIDIKIKCQSKTIHFTQYLF